MLEHLVPAVVSLLIGILVGWLTALAIKSAARTLGCLLAALFVLLQVLAYYGLMEWDWLQFIHQARPLGKIATGAFRDLATLLTYNVPFAIGSLVGFIAGFRRS